MKTFVAILMLLAPLATACGPADEVVVIAPPPPKVKVAPPSAPAADPIAEPTKDSEKEKERTLAEGPKGDAVP